MGWKRRKRGSRKQKGLVYLERLPSGEYRRSGRKLEDHIAGILSLKGMRVWTRTNFCDVLAYKPWNGEALLIECKNYFLSRKALIAAEKELKRNEKYAKELLKNEGLKPKKIVKILVAQGFGEKARDVVQMTPQDFAISTS